MSLILSRAHTQRERVLPVRKSSLFIIPAIHVKWG